MVLQHFIADKIKTKRENILLLHIGKGKNSAHGDMGYKIFKWPPKHKGPA